MLCGMVRMILGLKIERPEVHSRNWWALRLVFLSPVPCQSEIPAVWRRHAGSLASMSFCNCLKLAQALVLDLLDLKSVRFRLLCLLSNNTLFLGFWVPFLSIKTTIKVLRYYHIWARYWWVKIGLHNGIIKNFGIQMHIETNGLKQCPT